MDTDVEVVKNLDLFLKHCLFLGFESEDVVSSCIIGAVQNHSFIRNLLDFYMEMSFIQHGNKHKVTPNTVLFTDEMQKIGFHLNNSWQESNGIVLYPKEVFCPKNYDETVLNTTENTCTVHHFAGSWYSPVVRRLMWIRLHVIKRFIPFLDAPLNALYKKVFYKS